jgi:catechol 2,3-dioxygenase
VSITTRDIFGDARASDPAVPGSYGEAPRGFRLSAATSVGAVLLQVADLSRSLEFYRETLGLTELEREGSRAVLGVGEGSVTLVELHERRGAHAVPRHGRLGLFHFAILLPDRPSLGRFTRHLADLGVATGAADHLVSESIYLSDPDGLGIEVYADRPRESWRRVGRELMMATDPLDTSAVVSEAGNTRWMGMPGGTTMGHVHLRVGDLATAASFYSEALGFDRTVWSYPGAMFFAAGGYHHHLGTNVWAGPAAQPAAADEAQLLEWRLSVADPTSLQAMAESLVRAGYVAEHETFGGGGTIRTYDPWGTTLRLAVRRKA